MRYEPVLHQPADRLDGGVGEQLVEVAPAEEQTSRLAQLYARSGELFWTSAAGATLSLGPISQLGGWQWVNTGMLAAPDRDWITSAECAVVC